MGGRLEGKVALISGGARGQGATEAERFVAEGAKVVIGDVLDDEGKATAERIGASCKYVHLDVTLEEDWTAAVATTVDEFGAVDILVNNAGIFIIRPIVMTTLEDFERVVKINQTGVFLGMKAVGALHVRAERRLDHQHLVGGWSKGRGGNCRLHRVEVGRARHDEGGGQRVRRVRRARELGAPRHHRHANGAGVRQYGRDGRGARCDSDG